MSGKRIHLALAIRNDDNDVSVLGVFDDYKTCETELVEYIKYRDRQYENIDPQSIADYVSCTVTTAGLFNDAGFSPHNVYTIVSVDI